MMLHKPFFFSTLAHTKKNKIKSISEMKHDVYKAVISIASITLNLTQ